MRVVIRRPPALVCLLVLTLLAPHSARASGFGISAEPCRVNTAQQDTSFYNFVPFHFYKVPPERGRLAHRDIDFLWSDTYKSLFGTPLDVPTGPEQLTDLDRLGQVACELQSNPLGLPWTDIQLAYNYLAGRFMLRDTLNNSFVRDAEYNAEHDAPVGFRVHLAGSNEDRERNHLDTYLYAPYFAGQGQWQTYYGDGGTQSDPVPNYGMWSSAYKASAEDSLTGHGAEPLHGNSIQVPGPRPWQAGAPNSVTNRWTRSGGEASWGMMHEGLHAIDQGNHMHMYASGAEAIAGISPDPPRYDFDYHYSLSPTPANVSNAYPHWQSFMAWLAFNWRGADTTPAGWADDLVPRWAKHLSLDRTLIGLANRMSDSECAECTTYPGFAGLDGQARVQRLIHDWRVALYVNNPTLSGGKYGFPSQFGYSPAVNIAAWQNVDGVTWDDGFSIPPVELLATTDLDRTRWYHQRPGKPGVFNPRPLRLGMFGAEYFVFRAHPNLAGTGQRLIVRVRPDVLLERTTNRTTGCQALPDGIATGRVHASVVSYSQAADDSLWRHPEWATAVTTQSVLVDSTGRSLEFEIPSFGSTTQAVLVVLSLGDGPQGRYSASNTYDDVQDSLDVTISATLLRNATADESPVAVAASAQSELEPAWSHDGTKIAFRVVDGSGVSRIWVKSADGAGTSTALCAATSGQHEPCWSPRGGKVVYADGTSSRRLREVDVPTGASLQISSKSGIAHSPAYSPNGAFIAYLREWSETIYDPPPRDTVYVGPPVTVYGWDVRWIDLATGVDSLLWEFEGQQEVRGLRWTPNGRHLTFSHYDAGQQKFHLYELDVATQALTSHDSQAPDAILREIRPGFGLLLVEEETGDYQALCNPYAQTYCGCQPDEHARSTHWVALRDTLIGASVALGYRTGATFSAPRWSPDGTKVAYVTTQNDGGEDVYVAAATFNRAPYFTYTQTYYSVPDCQPFTLPLSAVDPDGDAVTFEVFDLPAGATLQSGGQISWPYPVLGNHWIIARALDPHGAVASKVIRLDVYAPGCGGGGGGGEDPPPILPGGGNAMRHADATRLIGGAGTPRAANTLLDGADGGGWIAQTARLFAAQADSVGNVTARLVGLRPGVFAVDRARLLVVDHAPQTVAVSTVDGIAVGTRRRAASAVLAGGEDLAMSLRGTTGGSRLVSAGEAIGVTWEPGEAIDGLMLDCARASTPEPGTEWGVRVEAEVGGSWHLAGRIRPRGGYDALAVALEPGVPVRLVFASETYVRELAGYSLAGAEAAPATVTSVALAETDANAAALGEADSAAVELGQGQRVTLSFAGPAPVADGQRTLFLDLVAAFTPEATAEQSKSSGTTSLPARFALHRNQPNPFGGGTTIRFDVPRAAHVRLEVFDAQGRRVRTLAGRAFEPGTHAIVWDGADASGQRARPGVYLYRMTAGSFREQRRMVLLGR